MIIRSVNAILVLVNLVFVEQKQHLQKIIAVVDAENNTFSIQIVKSVAKFSGRPFLYVNGTTFFRTNPQFLIKSILLRPYCFSKSSVNS